MSAKTIQIEEIKALQTADEILVRNTFVYDDIKATEDLQNADVPAWENVLDKINEDTVVNPVEILIPTGTLLVEDHPGDGPSYQVNMLGDYPVFGLHPKTWYGKPIFSGGGFEGGTVLSIEYRETPKYSDYRSGDGSTLLYTNYFFDNVGDDYRTTQDYIIVISQ